MSLKRKYGLLASSAAVVLLLAACGGDTGTEDDNAGTDNGGATDVENGGDTAELPEFEAVIENEGDPIEGGTLRVAMVAESAFPGIFSTEYYGINLDSQLMGPMLGSVLNSDEQYQWSDGAASMEFDEEANVVTLTLQEGVKWHDGEEVTVDDIVFTHEIVGDPDYDGVR